jgi:hypothetical protein
MQWRWQEEGKVKMWHNRRFQMKRWFLIGMLSVLCLGGFWTTHGMAEESIPARKDIEPEWYFPEWLGASPYAPVFRVLDTVNKYGAAMPKRPKRSP